MLVPGVYEGELHHQNGIHILKGTVIELFGEKKKIFDFKEKKADD